MVSAAMSGSQADETQPVLDEELARANTYALLGTLLAVGPSAETIALLQNIDCPEDADAADLAGAWAALRQGAQLYANSDLANEFHTLFIGIGRGELVPHGSWYLAGFLMEKPLANLRTDLALLGIERRQDVRIPEDHAAALCETMALLIGGDEPLPFARQKVFYEAHIGSWMGQFFKDMQAAKAANFYRSVGLFGERFLAVEAQYFAMQV